VVFYNKHHQNLKHKTNQNGFRQMFNGGEMELRAIAAHNVNKEAGKFQEGERQCWCLENRLSSLTQMDWDETTLTWGSGHL
jgi:hypothetical protein